MKIPKQKVVKAISDEGVEYLKVVDIRYPIISYLLSLPIMIVRMIRFQLQIKGVLPIQRTRSNKKVRVDEESKSRMDKGKNAGSNFVLGEPREQWVCFTCLYQGEKVSGKYWVKYYLIDSDLVDGTDVLEFLWKLDDGKEIRTYHMPDFFLRKMFSGDSALVGTYVEGISAETVDDFQSRVLIRGAKALLDDRSYENIKISETNHEVRLKYTGLKVSLASRKSDDCNINAVLDGVIGENDILPSFVLLFPLEFLIGSSSAQYDDEDEMWVSV